MRQSQAPHLKKKKTLLASPLARCQALQQAGGSPPKATVWECVCITSGERWWTFVSGSLCGEESSDVMSPVSRSLGPYAVLTCAQLQNKHGSSAFPETTGNLRHVPEYPLIGRYCFIHCQSNSSTDGVFSVLSNKETTWASLSVSLTVRWPHLVWIYQRSHTDQKKPSMLLLLCWGFQEAWVQRDISLQRETFLSDKNI